MHTLSDGTVREVGVVVGRAGNDGDIAFLREKLLVHETEIEALRPRSRSPVATVCRALQGPLVATGATALRR